MKFLLSLTIKCFSKIIVLFVALYLFSLFIFVFFKISIFGSTRSHTHSLWCEYMKENKENYNFSENFSCYLWQSHENGLKY